ncbi:MAG TPA: hypothetical protein VFN64_00070 [Burkholderiaceae bacterium]|nr:hypothetical protein [Burkholderiaceae bacterium]
MNNRNRSLLGIGMAFAAGVAAAQAGKGPTQVVKPPVSQAWIDVATFSGFGMPAMGGGPPGASPMSMMSGMFGGGQSTRNAFGHTQTSTAGRWVDVTLYTSRNPSLAEALQAVPAGTQLAPTLKLVAPKIDKPAPAPHDEGVVPQEYERPKGKMYLYWGCGETVRAGQPRVLDMATAKPEEYGKFFVSRRATQRGAHSGAGRPLWPNEMDARMVPAGASLVGEHGFSGQGVPEGFRFGIPAAQDLMPEVALKQTDAGGSTQLEWAALPTARAYFIAAMGAKGGMGGMGGGSDPEMVFWTSSEVPETGSGLVDYQTNPSIDRWLQERVLLAPTVTRCAVPKGIFGEGGGAMLRMIAYGSELNLAHPPRPTDLKIAWEPQWAVKVRVKSVANAMLGVDMGEMQRGPAGRPQSRPQAQDAAAPPAAAETKQEEKMPDAVNILRGILGR